MSDLDNFDRLVLSLNLDERQDLLEKLKGQSNISNEPLYKTTADSVLPAGKIEDEYARLPWYTRFWYSIMGFFKSRTPVEVFADNQVVLLGRRIEEVSPGTYDYQRRLLLAGFHGQIVRLKEAARFFYSALDISVNQDRGGFFAFLASLEIPEVHRHLISETNPEFIAEKNPEISDAELRHAAQGAMEAAFNMISDDHRVTMYFNARSLFCLKQLSSFLYDRVIMAFSTRPSEKGETCSVNVVRELLLSLNDILFSIKNVPPMTLLESLFVFVLQNRAGESGFDFNQEIRMLLVKAGNAISIIRDFNKNIPLTWIIRCSSRDMSISPKEISGGEDWLLNFRDYWRKWVDSHCSEYIIGRRQRALLGSFSMFLNNAELKNLEFVQGRSNPDGFPLKEAFALSFLLSFYSEIFMPEMNPILRSIMLDGDFFHKEHRSEFSLSYDDMLNLEESIKRLEGDISPDGEYGRRYAQARSEMSSIPVKRRKIQIVLEDAAQGAQAIIKHIKISINSIVNILGTFQEKNTALEETMGQLQRLLDLLEEIEAMEGNS